MTASMMTAFDKPPEWTWAAAHASVSPAGPVKQIESVYEYPFLAHTPIEPMNTTVHIQGDRCEVWTPTRDGQGVRKTVAKELGMPESNITVHVMFAGGLFGSRFNRAYTVQAVLIARRMKLPVQLMWTREDTIAHDEFRQCGGQKLRGSVDSKGNVLFLGAATSSIPPLPALGECRRKPGKRRFWTPFSIPFRTFITPIRKFTRPSSAERGALSLNRSTASCWSPLSMNWLMLREWIRICSGRDCLPLMCFL